MIYSVRTQQYTTTYNRLSYGILWFIRWSTVRKMTTKLHFPRITKLLRSHEIKLFISSEHNNVYNHQHPSMATCFRPFLDHPQANI